MVGPLYRSVKKMNISILGAGNVATHLARAFSGAGHRVAVWNRSETGLLPLRGDLGCFCTVDMAALPIDTDVYIIAVKDDAVASVAHLLAEATRKHPHFRSLVAHTAGSLPMSLLEDCFGHCGVFYPMQTFSKSKPLDYSKIPFFVEEKGNQLKQLARSVSEHVFNLTSEQRKVLHLASVFACNFANHCYSIAEDVLKKIGVPFTALLPLIGETTDKVSVLSPLEAQTGPAVREDQVVMNSQLQLLSGNPDLQEIYARMSESIIKFKSHDRL